MQLVKKVLLVVGIVWFFFLIFMPKTEFYFLLEKALQQQSIKINETEIDEGLFSLDIHKATIYYKGIPIATAEVIGIFSLLVYTDIRFHNVKFDTFLKGKVPQKIMFLKLRHSIVDPLHVAVEAEGSFGAVRGNFDLKSRQLHLDFIETKEIDSIKQWLQKDKKGYYYEISL